MALLTVLDGSPSAGLEQLWTGRGRNQLFGDMDRQHPPVAFLHHMPIHFLLRDPCAGHGVLLQSARLCCQTGKFCHNITSQVNITSYLCNFYTGKGVHVLHHNYSQPAVQFPVLYGTMSLWLRLKLGQCLSVQIKFKPPQMMLKPAISGIHFLHSARNSISQLC